MAARLAGKEIEEVPLRHEGDEPAARRQVAEVGDREKFVADRDAQPRHLLVRQAEERLEDTELVQNLQRRRVDRVAAEVAQEVGMLLEDDDVCPRARQEQAEHHPGGTAARHDAPDPGRHGRSPHPRSVAPRLVARRGAVACSEHPIRGAPEVC
jgi:hypothetical protein